MSLHDVRPRINRRERLAMLGKLSNGLLIGSWQEPVLNNISHFASDPLLVFKVQASLIQLFLTAMRGASPASM
jgi:hypothetical protein